MYRQKTKSLFLLAPAAAVFLMLACSEQVTPVTNQSANAATEMIYVNGEILTMDGESPSYAEAIATLDGKIVFVGAKDDALSRYPAAEQRDLQGKTMLPGFLDPHGHFMFALNMVNQVNVANPPVGNVVDIPSTIAALKVYQAEAQVPAGGWIVAWGYDQEGLAEKRHMSKSDLDTHFPDHKVMLIHVSGHGAVLNSNALEYAGIDENTETPAGGVILRMSDSNEPAGLLMETAYLPVFAAMPQPSEAELLKLMKPAQMMYARAGYTHAHEGFTHQKDLDFLIMAAADGRIFLDIVSLPGFTEIPVVVGNPDYKFGEYQNGLKLQGIKWTQDGSPQGRTAHVTEAYLTGGPGGEEDWVGQTAQPKQDFIDQIKAVSAAGLQVFIHANGDATVDQLIEAIEQAGITAASDRRPVAIHSQFQRPDHLPKYVELGISPSYFTNHCFYWGDVHIKNIGRDNANFISPLKAATDLGIVYSNHTDFNITPLDPFFIVWTAMARETRSGEILGEDQRVDAYTALQGLTTGPAWQVFEENRKGRIKEGLLADFVILDANPLTVGVDNVRSIEILETIKAGVTIYLAK